MNAKLDPKLVLPCILTCPVNPERTFQFFHSYQAVAKPLFQPPLVVVDLSAGKQPGGEYFTELRRCLSPLEVITHQRSQEGRPVEFSVEDAVELLIGAGVAEYIASGDSSITHLMFMEDDFCFLPNFEDELAKVDPSQNRGFTTFWHSEEWKLKPDSNELDHKKFWGAQCLLIPIQQAGVLVRRHEEIKNKFRKWWDIYWSLFFESEGIKIYCTDETCVQEIPGPTRLRLNGI